MFIQPQFKPFTIKIVGVGGVGSQTVREMESTKRFKNVEFITIGRKQHDFSEHTSDSVIQLAPDKDISYVEEHTYNKWRAIALANKESIRQRLLGSDIVFVCCNEGKGIGTGVSPIVADIAHECGALVIAIVTDPFSIEGKQKKEIAKEGIALLKKSADTVIVVHKQRIFDNIQKDTFFTKAYGQIKTPLYESVRIISDIIHLTKLINIDLSDLKLIMGNAGNGFIGEGEGSGKSEARIQKALDEAFSFPLTDNSIAEAGNLLIHITGGIDLSMDEVNTICSRCSALVSSQANMKYGVSIDAKMKEKIKVSIIATMLNDSMDSGGNPWVSDTIPDTYPLSDLDVPAFVRNKN